MKKYNRTLPVLTLFVCLFFTEAVTTRLITSVFPEQLYFWFDAVVNASLLGLLSLVILRVILGMGTYIRGKRRAREWLYLQFGLSIFGIELLLTLFFSICQLDQHYSSSWDIEKAALFATISSIAVYIYVLAPKRHNITRFFNRLDVRYSTSYLFGMTLLLLFVGNIYEQQKKLLTNELVDHEADQLALIDKTLTYRISETVLDTLALATQPDFIRHLAGDADSIDELKLEFSNLVQTKHSYDQIRFIDESGYEMVRVNKGKDKAEIVQDHQLQDKRGRYYVPEAGSLSHGKVYISPLDLNVEFGEIELPYKPITRIATPVKSDDDTYLGLIVINIMANHLIQHLVDANDLSKGQIMLLNQDGYWLHGDMNTPPLWAFMFSDDTSSNLSQQNPELWRTVNQSDHGVIHQGENSYIYHRVRINDDQRIKSREQSPFSWPEWVLITRIDSELITQMSLKQLHLFMLVCALLAVVSGIGTYLYSLSQLYRNSAETKVRHMAEHDPLTGLFNRRNLMQQLDDSLQHARNKDYPLAVFYLDLDNFKPVNDRLGHEAGDEVLKHISQRLNQMLRKTDILARIGGDEFVIIIHNPESIQKLEEIAIRIIEHLKQPIHLDTVKCQLGVSIGIAISKDHKESRNELLKAADLLMLEAKKEGKSCYRIAQIDNRIEH